MSFTGGKLKLKGGATLGPSEGVKKKKKKNKDSEAAAAALARVDSADAGAKEEVAPDAKEEVKRALHGRELPQPSEDQDRRTEAEKRFQKKQQQLEVERLKKLASKSHRDRIKEFNDYLANLSVGDERGRGPLLVICHNMRAVTSLQYICVPPARRNITTSRVWGPDDVAKAHVHVVGLDFDQRVHAAH
jgi:protein FAM32A